MSHKSRVLYVSNSKLCGQCGCVTSFVVGNRQSSRDLDFPAQCPVRQDIGKYIIGTCARFSRKLKILVVRIVSMWMEGIKHILDNLD